MTESLYIYRSNANSISRDKGNPRLFVNALNTMFGTYRCVEEMSRDIPFLREHPEWVEKLAQFQVSSVEDYYAVPQFHQIGRQELEGNEQVAEAFRSLFGKKAEFMKKTVFDALSAQPYVERETGDFLESLAYRKKMKETMGWNILTVLP
jgi:hypothetical protein